MIEAIIKSTGALIDRPRISRIVIENESVIAVKRKNEETEKIEQLTIAQLFDSFLKTSNYLSSVQTEPESKLFEEWFSEKYIKGRSLETSLISLQFRRI